MKNVIEALRYMAEHGGYWSDGAWNGEWQLDCCKMMGDYIVRPVGFNQSELREFLEHYDNALSFACSYDPN